MDKVYIQTYSVRNEMEKDYVGSLKRIAEIGYAGVEFAGGYGGLSAAEMKKVLADLNLDCVCSHVGVDKAEGDIDYLAELGARYIVCPMAHFTTHEEGKRLAEQLSAVGRKCKAAGLKYGYHNHTQEFADPEGKFLLETLMENTDPDEVVFELDVGWCTTAGVDAAQFIQKHAGRFELIHAKEAGKVTGVQKPFDFSKVTFGPDGKPIFPPELLAEMDERNRMNVPTGTGLIDWKQIYDVATAQGAKAFIVEREWDYLNDIFACVKADYEYLAKV